MAETAGSGEVLAGQTAGNLVVLGAGYGGLSAALRLSRLFRQDHARRVVLVDRHPYHTLKTRLHEAAVGRADVAIPVERYLRRPNISFLKAEVRGVNLAGSRVLLGEGELAYERLVLATGSVANFFGIPGLAENSAPLQSKEDADRILSGISGICEYVAANRRAGNIGNGLRYVVGGGGVSGVEFAAELAEKARECGGRHGLGPDDSRVVLLEGGPRLVPFLDEEYSRSIEDRLRKAGVSVMTGTRIVRCEPGRVVLDSGVEIEARLVVWTGGVKASDILKGSGFTTGQVGRVVVDEFLRVEGQPAIYAIGDNALARDPGTGKPVATSAQLALQEGRLVAGNIRADLTGGRMTGYRPRVLGEVVSLGRHLAVGWLALPWMGRFNFLGFVASLLKQAIKERHLWLLWRESRRW